MANTFKDNKLLINPEGKISTYIPEGNLISTYFGPGFWYIIHRTSTLPTIHSSIEEQEHITFKIESTISSFPCESCLNHALGYLERFPIKEYFNLKYNYNDQELNIGIFHWTWKFHNAVNTRIGKPTLDLQDAIDIYYNPEVCNDVCDLSNIEY